MKNSIFTFALLVVLMAMPAFAQQDSDSYVVQGYQFASASTGKLSSPTMQIQGDIGRLEKVSDLSCSVLKLELGEYVSFNFSLPTTATKVRLRISYYSSEKTMKGRIRLNNQLVPENSVSIESGNNSGFTMREYSLENIQSENELRIFPVNDVLHFLNITILYEYTMPSCTVGNVTVKLLSPDSDKDVLGSDLKIEWAGTGTCDKGWVTLKYKDGEEWKTVPGAESFDLGDEEWKDASHGQFVWKDHGLKEFPELKIVYSEDESPKHREARLAAEAKAKAEQEERERKAQADQIAKEAQKLLQNKKVYDALDKIEEALKMYPYDYNYIQLKQRIIAAKDPCLIEGRKAGDRAEKEINGVKFVFRWCPAGKFKMGSPVWELNRSPDEILHEVEITKGFWIMEMEVTQKQWKAIMGYNPSEFEGDDNPVENVSWNNCKQFCQKCKDLGLPVQLPTEAQWEYACRAGSTGPYAGNLEDMAWYWGNWGKNNKKTHPVGKKNPNAWGLYDMHGNVFECCEDYYGDYPNGDNVTKDPTGPFNGNNCISRGGYWDSSLGACRSAYRLSISPSQPDNYLGFRCVINPE